MAVNTLECLVLVGVSRLEKLNAGTRVRSYPVNEQAPADLFFMRHPSLRLADANRQRERGHQRHVALVRAGRPAGGTGGSPTRSPAFTAGVGTWPQALSQRWEGRPNVTAAWRLTDPSVSAAADVSKALRPLAFAPAIKRPCAKASRTPSASRRDLGF